MDRGMKLMFGMMTVAICLMAVNMFGNNGTQAYAANVADRGDTEPTIVSFRVTPIQRYQGQNYGAGLAGSGTGMVLLTRMWSNGTTEMNVVGSETIPNLGSASNWIWMYDANEVFSGWITVQDSVAGYACAGYTDFDREVGVTDLLAVIESWGACEEDPPVNLPPDLDI